MPLSRFLGDPAAAARTAQDAVAAIYANPPKSGGAPFDPYSTRYCFLSQTGTPTFNPYSNPIVLPFLSTVNAGFGGTVAPVEDAAGSWNAGGTQFTPSISGRWLVTANARLHVSVDAGIQNIWGSSTLYIESLSTHTTGIVESSTFSAAGTIGFAAATRYLGYISVSRVVRLISTDQVFTQYSCFVEGGAAGGQWRYDLAAFAVGSIGFHYVGP